jgi:hypothetical protein
MNTMMQDINSLVDCERRLDRQLKWIEFFDLDCIADYGDKLLDKKYPICRF